MIRRLLIAGSAALLLMGVNAYAETRAEATWQWQRALSPSGKFSVEVPCSTAEVVSNSADLGLLRFDAGTAVACRKAGWFFGTGMYTAPDVATQGSQSLFDREVARLVGIVTSRLATRSSESREIVMREIELSGHRALVVRETLGGRLVRQDGFVEAGKDAIILHAIIAYKDQGADMSAVPAVCDKLVDSLQVSDK